MSLEEATLAYYKNPVKHRRHATHPAIKAFTEPKIEWMVKQIPEFHTKSLLNVCGGRGYWSNYMVKYCPNVHIIDMSLELIKLNSLPEDQKHLGSAYELPWNTNTFDVVLAPNLLHHLDHPVNAIRQYRTVASKYVVIVEPVTNNFFMWLGCQYPYWEYGVKKYSAKFVKDLIKEAGGLEIVAETFIGGMSNN